jgi:ribosome maturation factor RimP
MTKTVPEFDPDEERLVGDTGTDALIASIIEPEIRSLGMRLVRVRLTSQNGLTLQIMAERADGTMNVEDCEALSHALSPVLDVNDPIDKAYHLEISSPGIDRPLVRRHDFARWQGHLVKLTTGRLVANRKRFRGKIGDVDDDGFVLARDESGPEEEAEVTIPFDAVAEARLILTDDLIRESLKADKAAKAAQAANQNERPDAPDEDD